MASWQHTSHLVRCLKGGRGVIVITHRYQVLRNNFTWFWRSYTQARIIEIIELNKAANISLIINTQQLHENKRCGYYENYLQVTLQRILVHVSNNPGNQHVCAILEYSHINNLTLKPGCDLKSSSGSLILGFLYFKT